MNRLIKLTHERLEKAKTPKGGYNAAQLKIIGIGYPPKKGWKKELEGKMIPLSDFIALYPPHNPHIFKIIIPSMLLILRSIFYGKTKIRCKMACDL